MQNKSYLTSCVATLQCNLDKRFLLPGNVTPHLWYRKFRDERGKPDLLSIALFSDIFAWCRNGTNEYYGDHMPYFDGISLSVSYDYFQDKFGFSKASIRRALVKLENYGVLKRTINNIEISYNLRVNRLFITIDSNFFNSCFRNSDLDIRAGQEVFFNDTTLSKKYISELSTKTTFSIPSEITEFNRSSSQSLQICTDPISNKKEIIKDRSMKSNFLQNSFSKKEHGNLGVSHHHYSVPLQLKDFYPLSTDDAKNLQIYSGREFSLNAMNEILFDMSNRLKDRWFKSKKGFLSYMSLAFMHEKRDAVKVSGENFKIKANLTTEEKTVRIQEEFLSEIEYSLQVSPEWHLKKKLCSVFEREKAYNLLKSYTGCKQEGDTFKIFLNRHVELTKLDREVILNQARATHDSADFTTMNIVQIAKFEIIMPEKNLNSVNSRSEGQEGGAPSLLIENIEPIGIWEKIRKGFIIYYGEKGASLDMHWLSKLTSEVNEERKIIKLTAPNNFIRDWIQSNYALVLKMISRRHDYAYVIC